MTDFNDKQRKILQIAEKRFAEKGFDGTSVRDIAHDAGVNIAMISYYFGSKEKMLEALILSRLSDLRLELLNLAALEVSPLEKINRLIEIYVSRIATNRNVYKILHFELNTQQRAASMEAFAEVKKSNLACINQIIREGQEKGVFSKKVNTLLIPTTIVGTFFHFNLNEGFYMDLLGLKTDTEFETYIQTELTQHIKRTINALLLHEK